MARKVIITAALLGSALSKKNHPNAPITPEEMAQAAYECYNEGAAIAHVHARDEKGVNTGRTEVYQRIKDLIRAKCNMVLYFTTGGGPELSADERLGSLDAQPDMASLDIGSLMRIHGPYRGIGWDNPPWQIEQYAEEILKRNIKASIGIFHQGMYNDLENLIAKNLLTKPYYINIVLNMPYQACLRATPSNLTSMMDKLPKPKEDCVFGVTCIGRDQLAYTTMSMCLGGNVRVGFEDNIYYTEGELAKSNAQFVARTARIARELGLEIASPDEAKEILGIPPRKEST